MSTSLRLALIGGAIVVTLLGAVALFAPSSGDEPASPTNADPAPAIEPDRADQPKPVPPRTATSAAGAVDAAVVFDPERASESDVMARAKDALRRAPRETLRLIEIADRRFGIESEARRTLEIEALMGLQQVGEAHGKAELFYRHYPHSPEVARIERLTGSHPRPWGPGSSRSNWR